MTIGSGDPATRSGKAHPQAWIAVAVLEALLLEGAIVLMLFRPWGDASLFPGMILTVVFLFYFPLLVTPSERWEQLWLVQQLRKYDDRN